MAKYRKLIVALIAGVLVVLNAQFGADNSWSQAVIAAAGAFGVYAAPNGGGDDDAE